MAKFSNIIKENNENLLIDKFVEKFREKTNKKLKYSKRFSFVLTGGLSPIKLYKRLAKLKQFNWKNIDFFYWRRKICKRKH